MKKKIILFISVVIIAIGVVYFKKNDFDQQYKQKQPFLSLEKKNIKRISISRGSDTVDLFFEDNKWVVGIKKVIANQTKVDDLLKRIFQLNAKEVVSSNGLSLERYSLDSTKRKEIRVYDNQSQVVLHAYIGRFSSLQINSTYWKFVDNNEVYRCCGNITNDVIVNSVKWKNLNTAFFLIDTIIKIKVSRLVKNKKQQNEFLFKNKKWTLNRKKVDSTLVEKMIKGLRVFQADDIIQIDTTSKETIRIELFSKTGDKEVHSGFLDKSHVYFSYHKENNIVWYQIPIRIFKKLLGTQKEFKKK